MTNLTPRDRGSTIHHADKTDLKRKKEKKARKLRESAGHKKEKKKHRGGGVTNGDHSTVDSMDQLIGQISQQNPAFFTLDMPL